MPHVVKCSLCRIGNIREHPEFGLCPNCLKDMKIVFATLMEMTDSGKKNVPLDDLLQTMEKRLGPE
jgi:hypothetical protein